MRTCLSIALFLLLTSSHFSSATTLQNVGCSTVVADQQYSPEKQPLETVFIKHRLAVTRALFQDYLVSKETYKFDPKRLFALLTSNRKQIAFEKEFYLSFGNSLARHFFDIYFSSYLGFFRGSILNSTWGWNGSVTDEDLYKKWKKRRFLNTGISMGAFSEIRNSLLEVINIETTFSWKDRLFVNGDLGKRFEELLKLIFIQYLEWDEKLAASRASWQTLADINPEWETQMNQLVDNFFAGLPVATLPQIIPPQPPINLLDPALKSELEKLSNLNPPSEETLLTDSRQNPLIITFFGVDLDEYLNVISRYLEVGKGITFDKPNVLEFRHTADTLNKIHHAFQLTKVLVEKYTLFASQLKKITEILSEDDERFRFAVHRMEEFERTQSIARLQLVQAKTTFDIAFEYLSTLRGYQHQSLLSNVGNQ